MRPNGYDGAAEPQVFEPTRPDYESMGVHDFRSHMAMPPPHMLAGAADHASMYTSKAASYSGPSGLYQPMQYADHSPVATGMHYTTVPPQAGVVDNSYAPTLSQPQNQSAIFHPAPLQQINRPDSPPETYTSEQYGQHDLSELLGTMKLNEAGTGMFSDAQAIFDELQFSNLRKAPYLSNKLKIRNQGEEEPLLPEEDEYRTSLPPLVAGPGQKIRIPPELMPDDETILHYFDIFFTHVHPYVPIFDRASFYRQWQTDRESVSPLVLEAIFSLAGRIVDDPTEGQQWLALATSGSTCWAGSTCRTSLTLNRARRFIHGHSTTKHTSGAPFDLEGERGCAQTRLLLPFLDERCSVRPNGQGVGPG